MVNNTQLVLPLDPVAFAKEYVAEKVQVWSEEIPVLLK